MSVADEYNVASRYRTVRKHLDSLGYKQALTLDALPLIEKLLADLIQTTESLKHFKSIAQENIEAHTQLQSTIDPYKCDNVRLVQECNQLHSDLVKEKESHQKQIKDLKKEIHKLECECNDLQLVSSRNLHRIKELETESAKKSKRILELQGKCLKPTISNVGLASKKRSVFPLRRPVIEGEPLPKIGAKSTVQPNQNTVEPKVVDLLSMADHKMNCLSHEVTKLKGELSLQNDNVQSLKCQLATKEKEILRLKKMLDGGRPYSAVSRDCVCKNVENMHSVSSHNVDIKELNILQQEKLQLEQQLKEALNKQHDAMTQALKLADRNEELEKELRDIDHIALAVEADCNSAVKENNKRVSKLQEKLEDVVARVHVLESELTIEHRKVQELSANLEDCRLEKLNIQRSLESALDDKKHMTDRINELTVIEKNLNEEIDRMAKENERQRQDIIQLQYSNKMLKDQLTSKEILFDVNEPNLKDKRKKNDYNREQNDGELREIYKERNIFSNGNGAGYNVVKLLNQKETEVRDIQQEVEQLKRERDFYKNEYNSVKDNINKTVERDHAGLWSRIRELKRQLGEKEDALDKLQREKEELFREKMNSETRMQSYKADHKTPHRPCNICKHGTMCNCSPLATKDAKKIKSITERLERERDIARADVDRLIEERDALRERLKMAAEAHTSEQRRLKENLTDLEARLKQVEKERQELLLTQGARKATISGLEDQSQDLREELKRIKQELGIQRTQYFQLRALQDQTDQALADAQNQLSQSEAELNKAFDRNRSIERQKLQLENQVKELQQEINNFKENMSHLDREKDQLLMVLDEKTERIVTLEREIMSKEQQVMGYEHQIRELQHKNEICVDQSADQERQLRSMQLEMESLRRQLQAATYDRENAIQENCRIQDDLAAVTCEVRNLQRELEASRAESVDLKRQLQTYVSEVRRAEELLNRKENERTEMFNHFRSLSLEATVLENNNHSLESVAAEARGALQSARDRMMDLERELSDKEGLIRGYETQINELTQTVASMETQLRQLVEQKHKSEADLTALRDLCMKLDQQKDALMQQLDDKDAFKTQYDIQISRMKAEQAIMQDQMAKDRATVERLQLLLDEARQESITVQTNNQELQNEMSRLRSKVSELQSKLSSESTKLRQYQTQAAEYCKQISELRRQVTNERFDRARKEEENRRQSEDVPDPPTQTPVPLLSNSVLNESSDAKSRYLQNYTSNLPDDQTDRSEQKMVHPVAVSEHWKEEHNCRCNHTREWHRDIPCINIILRSDCKMHSNLYSYVQKNGGPTETSLNITDEVLRQSADTKALSNVSKFDSFHKRYDDIYCNTEYYSSNNNDKNNNDKNNNTYLSKIKNKGNVKISHNTLSQEPNNDPPFSNHINVAAKNVHLFPKTSETELGRTTVLIKDTLKSPRTDDKINSNPSVNKCIEYSMITNQNLSVAEVKNNFKYLHENNRFCNLTEQNVFHSIQRFDTAKMNFAKLPERNLKVILGNSNNFVQTSFNPMLTNAPNNSEFIERENSLKFPDCRSYKDFLYLSSLTTSDYNSNLLKNHEIHLSSDLPNKSDNNKYDYVNNNSTVNKESNTLHQSNLKTSKLQDSSIQENGSFCANSSCMEKDCSLLNGLQLNRPTIKSKSTKPLNQISYKSKRNFHHTECDNKCLSTIDSTLSTLQNMLEGIKGFKDKDTTKYNVQDSVHNHKEMRCKNMEYNYSNMGNKVTLSNVSNNYLHSLGSTKPECMKVLQEIKRHIKALEQHLTIMNNSIKAKRKVTEKYVPTSENYSIKQQRDICTQNPEKKNAHIQESCLNHCCEKTPTNSLMQLHVNFDSQYFKSQGINLKDSNRSRTVKKKIIKEDKNYKKKNNNTLNFLNVNNLREGKSAEVQCNKSLSFHVFNSTNAKPLATSATKKLNLSTYKRTTSTSIENLQTSQAERSTLNQHLAHFKEDKNETINSVNTSKMNVCSNCGEDDVVMLLLTKNVNGSKCPKSKYKKMEFLNFKPKCITNSCAMYDPRSVRCKLSKRKSQIPILFKLKSVRSGTKNNCHYIENSRECCGGLLNSKSVTDLETTVWTQSSNLQINTATSVPSISLNKNYFENCTDRISTRKDGCIIS